MKILTDRPVLAGTVTGLGLLLAVQIIGRVLLAVFQ